MMTILGLKHAAAWRLIAAVLGSPDEHRGRRRGRHERHHETLGIGPVRTGQ
jgi:hypothetical protein